MRAGNASALAATALLTSCLLAPARPSGTSSDGGLVGDGALGDGGAPSGPFCPGSGDVFGAAVAFDRTGSGYDSVYRVGVRRDGGPFIARFDDLATGSACAADTTPLALAVGSGATLDALDVFLADRGNDTGSAVQALVLASGGDGSAEVHELVETAGHLVDTTIYSEPGLAPTAVATTGADDRPAFVTYIPGDTPQTWFGGGGAIGAFGATSAPKAGGDPVALGSGDPTPYYLVSPIPDDARTAVIGAQALVTYEVSLGSGTAAVQNMGADAYAQCDGPCPPRFARTLARADLSFTAFVFVPVAQDVRLVGPFGSFDDWALADGPGSAAAIDVGGLDDLGAGSDPELVVLYDIPQLGQEVGVFLDVGAGSAAATLVTASIDATVDRALVIRAGTARKILALADDASIVRCVELGSDTLAACTP